MKSVTLSPAEYTRLREFVEDVISLLKYDVEGVMLDLVDSSAVAAEILGIKQEEKVEEDE